MTAGCGSITDAAPTSLWEGARGRADTARTATMAAALTVATAITAGGILIQTTRGPRAANGAAASGHPAEPAFIRTASSAAAISACVAENSARSWEDTETRFPRSGPLGAPASPFTTIETLAARAKRSPVTGHSCNNSGSRKSRVTLGTTAFRLYESNNCLQQGAGSCARGQARARDSASRPTRFSLKTDAMRKA
jgi:hypothetical protein